MKLMNDVKDSIPESDKRISSANMGLLQAKYAADAGRLTRFALTRFYAALDRMLDQVTATTALDAGCGEGHILTPFLVRRYPEVYGIDLDIERLRYAKRHQETLRLLQGNLQAVPFPTNTADIVLALEVLEHVGQPEKALAEIHRVTRRYAILSVPNEPFWRIGNMARGAYWGQLGNTPEHINHWSVWGFKRFVSRHFKVLDVATPVTWTFILAEKK